MTPVDLCAQQHTIHYLIDGALLLLIIILAITTSR